MRPCPGRAGSLPFLGSVATGAICTSCMTTPTRRRIGKGRDQLKSYHCRDRVGRWCRAAHGVLKQRHNPRQHPVGERCRVVQFGHWVTCVKQGGTITVASAPIGGQQGVGVVMTNEANPKVESVRMVVDGNALAVSNNMGVQVGSAQVSVSGNTYTISGQAQGADMKNLMAGTISKDFSIKVTCG
jgi:hypothetical protein